MEQSEIDAFLRNGRSAITTFEAGRNALTVFAESFEARGGAPVLGDAALEIVYFANDLNEFMTPERKATVAKYRTDI